MRRRVGRVRHGRHAARRTARPRRGPAPVGRSDERARGAHTSAAARPCGGGGRTGRSAARRLRVPVGCVACRWLPRPDRRGRARQAARHTLARRLATAQGPARALARSTLPGRRRRGLGLHGRGDPALPARSRGDPDLQRRRHRRLHAGDPLRRRRLATCPPRRRRASRSGEGHRSPPSRDRGASRSSASARDRGRRPRAPRARAARRAAAAAGDGLLPRLRPGDAGVLALVRHRGGPFRTRSSSPSR